MRRPSRYTFTLVELPAVSRRKREAFTLVELLVVIGILVALIAILLPAVNKAYKTAQRTSMQADLAAISQALDAYRNDFADYPRPDFNLSQRNPSISAKPYPGAVILCWALVAPGPMGDGSGNPFGSDGAGDPNGVNRNVAGPGFRVRGTSGKVYPSYINLDRIKIGIIDIGGNFTTSPNGQYSDNNSVILDRYNHPVLYYPANKTVTYTTPQPSSTQAPSGYVAQIPYPQIGLAQCRFNAFDNVNPTPSDATKGPTLVQLKKILRDANGDGWINPGEDPVTEPFLLYSAGPDGQFGTADDVTNLP